MSIPIVIFHIGGQPEYFKRCVTTSSQNNTVYIIGDDCNKDTFIDNKNVVFFHIDDLYSSDIDTFKSCFVNYSGNSHNYEMNCFLRVFYVKSLFEKTGHEWMFHTDSDCAILESVDNTFENTKNTAYSICKNDNPFYMAASIHNALLNIHFCNTFIDLCFDVYKTKTKFDLIDAKIQWHKNTGIPGGICDMTFYYLLYSEKLVEPIIDLNVPIEINGELAVFDHAVSSSYGHNGENTYMMDDWHKKVIKNSQGHHCFITLDGAVVRALSIHLQGERTKNKLSAFYL